MTTVSYLEEEPNGEIVAHSQASVLNALLTRVRENKSLSTMNENIHRRYHISVGARESDAPRKPCEVGETDENATHVCSSRSDEKEISLSVIIRK